MTDDDCFLNEEQLEAKLNLKNGSLRRKRYYGFTLPHVEITKGTRRYHWPTVRDFLLQKAKPATMPPEEYTAPRRGRRRLVPASH